MQGVRVWTRVVFVWILLSFASTEQPLTIIQENQSGGVTQVTASCSMPCTAPWPPGSLYVTIFLNTITTDIELYKDFNTTQDTRSMMWHLQNKRWITVNNNALCSFTLGFTHTSTSSAAFLGSCVQGWEQPDRCPFDYSSSAVSYLNDTCSGIVNSNLQMCYNQTVISYCCVECLSNQLNDPNCLFGDLEPSLCDQLPDSECYDPDIEGNCCNKCQTAISNYEDVPNCTYGNRHTKCDNIQRHQCYNLADECCKDCHYLVDTTRTDCKYGDRQPSTCNNISTSDCYNQNIAYDCCETCKDLETDISDCRYGDSNVSCHDGELRECYNSVTANGCCETCANNRLSIPNCEYGDRIVCDNIVASDCTNGTTYFQCCEACHFLNEYQCQDTDADFCYNNLQPDNCYADAASCCNTCRQYYNPQLEDERCEFGNRINDRDDNDDNDDYDECSWIPPYTCYNKNRRRICCETCAYEKNKKLPESCSYGDRKPWKCDGILSWQCYDATIQSDCCETCTYFTITTQEPDCEYGDRRNCSNVKSSSCYNDTIRRDCCETCDFDLSQYYGEGCRYGNKQEFCYEREAFRCYETEFRDNCCMYCEGIEKTYKPGCEFGDKRAFCENINSVDCYTQEDPCCETCPGYQIFLPIDDCHYGDRQNCSSIQEEDCNVPSLQLACCRTCYFLQIVDDTGSSDCTDQLTYCANIQRYQCYELNDTCCTTCRQYESDTPADCLYGDRSTRCSSIPLSDCYDATTAAECCQTCDAYRKPDLPYSCRYGDRSPSCSAILFHGSECYNVTRRDVCCETCINEETGIASCRYGDILPRCSNIDSYECYINGVEEECCSKCPEFAAYFNTPDCEYGDRYDNCAEADCPFYSSSRLQDCCYECRDFINPTSSTTPTTEATTTSPTLTGTEKSTSNTVPIVAGAVGAVVFIAIVVVAVCCFMKRRSQGGRQKPSHGHRHSEPPPDYNQQHLPHLQHQQNRQHQQQQPNWQPYPPMPNKQQGTSTPGGTKPVNGASYPNVKGAPTRSGTVKSGATNKDEEVYDYIDLDDVKTVASFPHAPRPALPDRPETTQGYMEPVSGGTLDRQGTYDNPAFTNDPQNNMAHTYHILQKETAPPASQYSTLS